MIPHLPRLPIAKILLFCSFFLMSSGFRLIDHTKRWPISESDPYLWVKHCQGTNPIQDISLPQGDPLYGNTSLTIHDALLDIVREVNAMYGSYLKLEVYPDDVNNPGASSPHFTLAKAQKRTIEICEGSSGSLGAAGYTKPSYEGTSIVGCKISYDKANDESVKEFLRLAYHEIGHCFGLGHPQELTHSLMSYYIPTSLYRYQEDDIMGIRHLFPATISGVSHKEEFSYGLSCAYKK